MKYDGQSRKDDNGDILHEAMHKYKNFEVPYGNKPHFSVEPANDKGYDIELMTGKNSGKGSEKNRRI